jgi:DNA-directed RNA polymerase subunit N (RpoN/RPB10)
MYPYIVCNCGFSLGDKYDAFKALRAKIREKHFNTTNKYIDPENFTYSEDLNVELREVFEMLGIRLQCCKTHMLTQVEFKNIY